MTTHLSRIVVGPIDDVSREIRLGLITDGVVAEVVDAADAKNDLIQLR